MNWEEVHNSDKMKLRDVGVEPSHRRPSPRMGPWHWFYSRGAAFTDLPHLPHLPTGFSENPRCHRGFPQHTLTARMWEVQEQHSVFCCLALCLEALGSTLWLSGLSLSF